MENEFWLTMRDGTQVYVKKWSKSRDQKPKAIIQLSHGMVEHINRYHEVANFFAEHDFIVYGNDHRGHGNTGERQGLFGYLADQDGFVKVADDLYEITNHIKREYPEIKIFLFGHSMGSFLARNYIQKYSREIAGVILSGTGYYSTLITYAGKKIASLLPPKEPSELMNFIAFSTYIKRIEQAKTAFDWLTGDDQIIQSYMDDPYCGYIPTARFFVDLMTGLEIIHNQKRNKNIRPDLPMLIISGDADPVGGYAKGIWKTAALYEKAGLENILVELFDDGRHEILNEINRDEVYHSVLKWIISNVET